MFQKVRFVKSTPITDGKTDIAFGNMTFIFYLPLLGHLQGVVECSHLGKEAKLPELREG